MKCINHPDKESPISHCLCEACYTVRFSRIEPELRELLRYEIEAPATPIFKARPIVLFHNLNPYFRGHITYEQAKINIIKTLIELSYKLQDNLLEYVIHDTAKTD